MQAVVFFASILVAAVGQKLNANPKIPTVLIKAALSLTGMLIYLVVDQPKALSGPGLLEWLDTAWIWALAIPGLASLIGLAPGMATKHPTTNGG